MMSPAGHGATTLPVTSVRNDSLFLTVNPDKSVVIGSNMTIYSSSFQNAALFPPGYAVQSTSSFAQQSNAVVETTNVQYLIPSKLNQNLSRVINSISFSGSQTGLSGQGSLKISTTTLSPVENINVTYTTTSSQVMLNATALVQFSSSLYAGTIFTDYTTFNANWTATFGSSSWRDPIVSQIENSTGHLLHVTAFNGTFTPAPDFKTGIVKIGFVGVASGASSFIDALVNLLNALPPTLQSGLINIIQSVVNLQTGETVTMTYTGTSGIVTYTSTTNYVSSLDSQLNQIKGQFFQLLFNTDAALASNPNVSFLNATSITVSKISTKTSIDPNTGMVNTSLSGLIINPQVPPSSTSTNFTIPGFFRLLGSLPLSAPGVNITITGGSDSDNQVKIVVPAGTTPPSSTTSDSATWNNVMNASELQNVEFQLQPLPFSVLGFLTSTPGFILEAVIAAAIIAAIALYARRRRTRMSQPLTPMGPTAPPAPSPGPATPTQSTSF